jgi:membrane fusion protein, heavy metal efflux system
MSITRGTQVGVFVAVIATAVMIGRWSVSTPPSAAELGETSEEQEAAGGGSDVVLNDKTQDEIGLKVEAVRERPFASVIRATGTVTANESRVAHVRVLAPGRVESVHVRLGDQVKAGQPLVTYDNVELGQLIGEYARAGAALNRAEADSDVARRAVERATKLVEAGGIPRAEFERREAELKRAQAEVAAARGEVTNVERKLQRSGVASSDLARLQDSVAPGDARSRTVVRAPFSGVITAANVAPGEAVDTERELLTVADLSTVWVLGDIYQKDIASVRAGQRAEISTESYPGEKFLGRLTNVSDVLDPSTRTAKVRAEVPNGDRRLKLQMFVTLQIPTAAERAALIVPSAALQEIDGETVVFVQVNADTFQKRVVQSGPGIGGLVPIVSGLKPGEKVVIEGAFMLKGKLKAGSIEAEGEEEGEKGKGKAKPSPKNQEEKGQDR